MVKYVADQVTKEQVRMVVDDMLNNVTDQVTKEEKFRPKKGKGSIVLSNK